MITLRNNQKNKTNTSLIKKCFPLWVLVLLAHPSQCANDLTRPLVPMSDYPNNYRTLNCWECFEAQGRMCHHEGYDHSKVFSMLESGNKGDGFCCKNDVTEGICVQGYIDLHCSTPSVREMGQKDGIHNDIFSPNDRNYQMFAFCPGITPK